jgi:hypothetical protein
VVGEQEVASGAARPAAEPGSVAQPLARRVEDADVHDVGAEAGAGVVGVEVVAHLERAHALRHPERQVVPVRGLRVLEVAVEVLGDPCACRGRGKVQEGFAGDEPGAEAGAAEQQRTTVQGVG